MTALDSTAARDTGVTGTIKRKQPATAWALSFIYPGAGQIYNGDWVRAAAFAVPATIGWALYWENWEGCVENGENWTTRTISAVVIMAAWIGSQLDAARRASAINRERGLSLKVGPAPHSAGLSLARFRF